LYEFESEGAEPLVLVFPSYVTEYVAFKVQEAHNVKLEVMVYEPVNTVPESQVVVQPLKVYPDLDIDPWVGNVIELAQSTFSVQLSEFGAVPPLLLL
jgi:hypothetical protein